ncbi:hypothetical protein RE428_18340 [Marinobacter nanhaiticus D15-8W]|nr:hypothetical protein RE428_18340 [Marinobacter nanhaiticus D15-8W]
MIEVCDGEEEATSISSGEVTDGGREPVTNQPFIRKQFIDESFVDKPSPLPTD